MKEKMSIEYRSSMESIVVKVENMPVQVTTNKLTKDNYLHRAAAITMRITGISHITSIGRGNSPMRIIPCVIFGTLKM